MRPLSVVVLLGWAVLGFTPAAASAAAPVSDSICMQATKPVNDYFEKTKDPATTIETAITFAQNVVDAYDLCAAESLADGGLDNVHYAELWSARYEYVIGGWQHLDGNDGLARVALQRAVKLTQEIIDWRPPAQTVYRSNDVNMGSGSAHNAGADSLSRFHDDALKVRDAAVKSLALLSAPAPPAPASPAPAATAH
jgi:hypothetical protein